MITSYKSLRQLVAHYVICLILLITEKWYLILSYEILAVINHLGIIYIMQ